MDIQEQRLLAAVIREHRWAALASQGADGPEASWVACAVAPDFTFFLLHLSRLAAHTRNLVQDPRASLALSEREREGEDPQLLVRVMLKGRAEVIPRHHPDYTVAAQLYQKQLPASVPLFEFEDFLLFRFVSIQARFVGGFARARTLDAAALRQVAMV
ncbi:MAG TPA: pyridoxamine 5'-phosphate oxidase family protein [Candidatus Competibacteraceae bacterium]|nr:pyridoxamine 5'-phosphate oxidase family protein [Candidatus Competibacteraceae bacterium]